MADLFLTLGTILKWVGYLSLPLFLLPLLQLVLVRPLLPVSNGLVSAIERVTGAALGLAMACAVLMVFAQLAVVIARYVFGLSFSWLSETVIYSFAALFLIAAAGALRDDAHVRVDILRPRFSGKGRATIELVGTYLFLFPICLLIFWSAISPSFVRSWAQFEASRESDGLPILFLFRTLIPLFATLLMAQGLAQALKAAQVLVGLREADSAHAQGSGA